MFRSLSNSWGLVKASAAVLRSDKELVVFPIVSAIGVLIVTATFAVPLFLAGLFDQMYTDGHGLQPLGMLVALVSVVLYIGVMALRLARGYPILEVIWDRDILQFILIGMVLFGLGLVG